MIEINIDDINQIQVKDTDNNQADVQYMIIQLRLDELPIQDNEDVTVTIKEIFE